MHDCLRKIAVCTSDWHITAQTPVYRRDDYQEAQFKKIEWILDLCRSLDADLYNAGDIFDSARQPRWLVNQYVKLFRSYPDVNHYACAGQHDQIYHSTDLRDTSFETLEVAGCIRRQDSEGVVTSLDWGLFGESPWGVESSTETVIGHFCVTEKPIEFIDYSLTAGQFMKKYPSRIAVTGDYHHAHYKEINGKLLVNPGSIMRNAKDTVNKKTSVYVIDTVGARLIDQVFLPIADGLEVFSTKQIEKDKKEEKGKEDVAKRFDAYINQASFKKESPDFEKILGEVVEKDPPTKTVAKEMDIMIKGGE